MLDDHSNINNFISKFKNSNDLDGICCEFDKRWLKSFNKNLVKIVEMEYESIIYDRVLCDGSFIDVNGFITSLENLVRQ